MIYISFALFLFFIKIPLGTKIVIFVIVAAGLKLRDEEKEKLDNYRMTIEKSAEMSEETAVENELDKIEKKYLKNDIFEGTTQKAIEIKKPNFSSKNRFKR